jgi:hypothetical protein
LMRLSFLSIGNVSQGQDNRTVANQLLAQVMWTPVSEGAVVMALRVVVASPVREATDQTSEVRMFQPIRSSTNSEQVVPLVIRR